MSAWFDDTICHNGFLLFFLYYSAVHSHNTPPFSIFWYKPFFHSCLVRTTPYHTLLKNKCHVLYCHFPLFSSVYKEKNLNFKEWVFASICIPSPPSSQISKERPFSQKKKYALYIYYTHTTKNGLHIYNLLDGVNS